MYRLELSIREPGIRRVHHIFLGLGYLERRGHADLPLGLGQVDLQGQDHGLVARLQAAAPLELVRARLTLERNITPHTRLFMNGWQSWTDSREFLPHESMETLRPWKQFILGRYHFQAYGDYSFVRQSSRPGHFHGWSYMYLRNGPELELLASLDEDSAFTAFYCETGRGRLTLERDCAGRLLRQGESFALFDLGIWKGRENQVFDAWFDALPSRAVQRPGAGPLAGWTSWYEHYERISQEVILRNLEAFSTQGPPGSMIQVDDGWQTRVGDWLSVDAEKFPQGLEAITHRIHASGNRAGLWLAPFAAQSSSVLAREHPEWLVKDTRGKPVMAGSNWGGFFALDIRKAPVQAYLRGVFTTILDDWGFDLVKLDFLYAACMVPVPEATRGELMAMGMRFLREWVGDKLILGCGVPLASAFGRVDYCRIGCDMGLDWQEPWYMEHLHRERVSTRRSLANTLGRRHLDGRAFLNDPDVFILRQERNSLTDAEKRLMFFINTLWGSLVFCSDQVDLYHGEAAVLFGGIKAALGRKLQQVHCRDGGIWELTFEQEDKTFWACFNLGRREAVFVPVLKPGGSPITLSSLELIIRPLDPVSRGPSKQVTHTITGGSTHA